MDAIHNTALILVTGTVVGYWLAARIETVQNKVIVGKAEAKKKQVGFKLEPSDCLNQ